MNSIPPFSTAILTWTREGRVARAEGNPEEVLGIKPPDLIGCPLKEVLGVETEIIESGTFFLRGHRQGRPVTYRLRVVPEASGDLIGEILELGALLEGAPPLQISRLSSSLSHEIRNPLSSVKMAVQTLARNPGLSPRDQRRLNIANREIRTLERMLSLLSEYGRDTPSHLESMSLRTLTQEAAASIDAELSERKTPLHIEEQQPVPKVRADAGRCRSVLAQLLLNVAMGQAPDSPVVVRLAAGSCGGVCLRVEDSAATLLPEDSATLFEPFGSRLARGAGLSLAALRRVMMGQGGQIHAEQAGAGTVFTLTFAPA